MLRDDNDAAFEGDPPAAAVPSALRDRRELALVAFARTRMPMVITDPRQDDNPIVLVNEAFLDLTGYAADEVIGRNCRFLQGPETDPTTLEDLRRAVRGGQEHIEVELENRRKDGSTFWNQLSIDAVRSDEGELLYYFASQKDVSARRRAEALEATERRLLLEVDHRAMNALALVQSIVRLTRADDVPGYMAAVLARVDALARAHRLLSTSRWSGARMSALIDLEVPASCGGRVRVRGDTQVLPAALVQPLVLALHELVANAVAHGSLNRGGTLCVDVSQDEGGVHLLWREQDAPAPEAAIKPGFGLNLVRSVIERQLGGRLEIALSPNGLEARLSIPVRIGTACVTAPSEV